MMERSQWLNLNGVWQFEIDKSRSGHDRKFYERDSFDSEILVPFCPESSLSGVKDVDFLNCVWYYRKFTVPEQWRQDGRRVILHFGACDFKTDVFVNKEHVGTHKGGYSSFSFDITEFMHDGENTVVVSAEDDPRNPMQARGKQCGNYFSMNCDYTRTTGIWQTVWLECRERKHVKSLKMYPDLKNGTITIHGTTSGLGELSIKALYEGRLMGQASVTTQNERFEVTIELAEQHPWELGMGRLYDLFINFEGDEVKSYFGLRDIAFDGFKFLLNGESCFQRLVLDQGFYEDGIYTARDEETLIRDIDLSMAAGFNGARLHQKVFEPRFLYHCDKKGYMVWGEYPNWGLDISDMNILGNILPEWIEVVERDFNHPSIVAWCPFNETWDYCAKRQNDDILRIIYKTTKALDSTRPCVDASGNFHVITDIYDVHDYDQNPATLKEHYDRLPNENILHDHHGGRQTYRGEPVMISEYGGIGWDLSGNGWGYGNAPKTIEEFYERYEGLTTAILDNPCISGFCYTQLYDVEQEKNGLYTYGREPKFDMGKIKMINERKAAIEG